MANHQRGMFDIETPEKTYKFHLDYNALCEVEQRTGKTIPDLLDNPGLLEIRTIMHAGLLEADESITEKQAGDIIGEIGMGKASEIIQQAAANIFPQEAPTKKRKVNGKAVKEKNAEGGPATSLNS